MGKNTQKYLELGSTGPDVTNWQYFLEDLKYYNGAVDGQFGHKTKKATKLFQSLNGLKEDGIVGPKTYRFIHLRKKLLRYTDYEDAAQVLRCRVYAVQAVAKVEAPNSGFLPDGRPVILFEAHKFHFHTNGKYDDKYPHLSSKHWDSSLYKGGAGEHTRLAEAAVLNKEAAYKSASWGKFQILGENFYDCGFTSVFTFVDSMYESEFQHLTSFVKFIQANDLDEYLRRYDFVTFAKRYNGQLYWKNQYARKIRREFLRNAMEDEIQVDFKKVETIKEDLTATMKAYKKFKNKDF